VQMQCFFFQGFLSDAFVFFLTAFIKGYQKI